MYNYVCVCILCVRVCISWALMLSTENTTQLAKQRKHAMSTALLFCSMNNVGKGKIKEYIFNKGKQSHSRLAET